MHSLPTDPRVALRVSCSLLLLLAVAARAGADQIPVVNPSFESPAYSPCIFGGPVPAWASAGAWNPGLGTTCAPVNGFPAGVPDGVQVGFINAVGVPIKQVLSATLQANSPYTLRVDIGRRSDGFAMVHYAVRLVANGVTLAEDPGLLTPPLGGFATSTVTFTAPTGHPQLGKPLEIQLLLLQGPQANFDNVRLEGPTGTTPITGDLTNDGAVSGADLGVFLGSWGPCAACGSCPADFNGDCVVNATDLAILLGAWTG